MNLTEFSESLSSLIESAAPSVVRLEASRRSPSSGVILSSDGLVVATHHNIEWDEGIEVGLEGGATVKAKLLGRDPGTDLALLQIEASGLKPANFGNADAQVKVGQLVAGLARPGKTARASLGILSAVGQDAFRTWSGGRVDRYIQAELSGYPGFSGGPLLSASGAVLGINSWGLFRRHGITLPASTVKRVTDALKAHGQIRRGYLGISTQPVRLPSSDSGLLVTQVQPDSPAHKGGILLGDVLTQLDGQSVSRMEDLFALLDEERIGRELSAQVVRAGTVTPLSVTVGTRA